MDGFKSLAMFECTIGWLNHIAGMVATVSITLPKSKTCYECKQFSVGTVHRKLRS